MNATIVKRPVTKAQIRAQIEQQISEFLNQGGAVEEVQRGISGREGTAGPLKPEHTSHQQPRADRTYIPEVIAALEARRKHKPEKPKPAPRRQPRKKIIYDDFGEPLRWEWEE